ncbi:UNVERIFIED_CONTAM: hypothetical protein FKN15_072391 [Acipenser sinensis]
MSSSAESENLFWYKQTPGSSPRYLLHRMKASTEELRSDETEARFSKMTQADSVTQPSHPIVLKQSEGIIIQCTYETAVTAPSVFWYIQDPNQAPQLILSGYSQEDIPPRFRNRFSASHNKIEKTFHLNITAAVLSDSATYFCALSPTL